jgi:hypothetical protein
VIETAQEDKPAAKAVEEVAKPAAKSDLSYHDVIRLAKQIKVAGRADASNDAKAIIAEHSKTGKASGIPDTQLPKALLDLEVLLARVSNA